MVQAAGLAISFFAGVGGWVAAAATFIAVVRPERRRRKDAQAAVVAAVDLFASELVALRKNLGADGLMLSRVTADSNPVAVAGLVRGMTHSLNLPLIQATEDSLETALVLNRLRSALDYWNRAIQAMSVTADDLGGDYFEFVINDIKEAHSSLMREIRAAALVLQAHLPHRRESLAKIMVEHDGYIVS
ncbi:hypothetical protein XarbCFBP8152_04490 [Xanthomonas arboricola]|nr:hypothetical protein XarbCFBP8152_04490 [Xanthomonas arboricola]